MESVKKRLMEKILSKYRELLDNNEITESEYAEKAAHIESLFLSNLEKEDSNSNDVSSYVNSFLKDFQDINALAEAYESLSKEIQDGELKMTSVSTYILLGALRYHIFFHNFHEFIRDKKRPRTDSASYPKKMLKESKEEDEADSFSYFDFLPDEVCLMIFERLDYGSLLSTALVNKKMWRIIGPASNVATEIRNRKCMMDIVLQKELENKGEKVTELDLQRERRYFKNLSKEDAVEFFVILSIEDELQPKILYRTRMGETFPFNISKRKCKKYSVYTGNRVMTPKGPATVIGVYNGQLWFHVDEDRGASYWDNLMSQFDLKSNGFYKL